MSPFIFIPAPTQTDSPPIVLSQTLKLPHCQYLGQDDVTIFIKSEDFIRALSDASELDNTRSVEERDSFDIQCPLKVGDGEERTSRVHAAHAFGQRYYSVTIRKPPSTSPPLEWDKSGLDKLNNWPGRAEVFGLKALEFEDRNVSLRDHGWLECQSRVADVMYDGIFAADVSQAAGLVLISGGTGSGKTTILNALVARYLSDILVADPERRPHVVVTGDPIETVFYQDKKSESIVKSAVRQNSQVATRLIDYTARIIRLDTESVDKALVDALRETPSLYVISELREEADFRAALRFAGTGHLVFATAHNTSLVDALGNLMEVHHADKPSSRASLGQRLKAVAHMAKMEFDEDAMSSLPVSKLRVALPAIWRGNHTGIRSFVCDGLASLHARGVSEFKTPIDSADEPGVVGLAWTVKKLAQYLDRQSPEDKQRFGTLLRLAHQRDLQIR